MLQHMCAAAKYGCLGRDCVYVLCGLILQAILAIWKTERTLRLMNMMFVCALEPSPEPAPPATSTPVAKRQRRAILDD